MRVIDYATGAVLRRKPPEQLQLPGPVARRIAEVFGEELAADVAVQRIIAAVRAEGDAALCRLTAAFDGVELGAIVLPREALEGAVHELPADLVESLRLAADQIATFHSRQLGQTWTELTGVGTLGQIFRPLQRVGLYAPGGRACYPSTVLMSAIPARVAGVEEIVLASPPGPGGKVPALILAAAHIAQVDRVVAVGGAQAIAALAYGTESVPRVDKILGPGNVFVTLAKKQVFGDVAIDQLAGPTETVIVADDSAIPELVAADMLAQAEHDPLASAILITPSRILAEQVMACVDDMLGRLTRAEIALASLEENGAVVLVANLAQAVDVANEYAPEHLCLCVEQPWSLVDDVRNAGGVFVGDHSPEVMGDYIAGPSHVMPTGGTARFSSPLNALDFVKVTSLIALDEDGLRRLGPAAASIAEAEGLTAHAAAIRLRLHDGSSS